MGTKKHAEKHFTAAEMVRDVVIGMSDGLTVPFALAAGLTGAATNSGIIVTAGVAEIAAGAIAMGLGGYLASRSESDHYDSEERRERKEIVEVPEQEVEETRQILKQFGLHADVTDPLIKDLSARPDDWVNFMMRFELGLEKPQASRAATSAATIAVSYIIGGLVPLAPYLIFQSAQTALIFSICETLVALTLFGYLKGMLTGLAPLRSAIQTGLIGSLAATAAFVIARLLSA
jgi:VIT1/CCC1 family predicted Fe2+/Mn2+ transporter